MKEIKPLPPYKELLYYTGTISSLTFLLGIIFIYKNVFKNFQVPFILISIILGFLTYYMWNTRCPKCHRPFSKKEDESKEKDLGIKKIKRYFVSEIFETKKGERVDESKDYLLWPARFIQKFFYCNKCDWADYDKEGTFKRWDDEDKWNPTPNGPKKILVKETDNGYVRIGKSNKTNDKIIIKPLSHHQSQRIIIDRGNKCQICGSRDGLEVHHIIQRSNGGTNKLSNLIVLCEKHHTQADRGYLPATRLKMIVSDYLNKNNSYKSSNSDFPIT